MYIPADIVNNVLLGSLNSGKCLVLFSRCLIVKPLILFNRSSPFLSGLLQFFTFTFFFSLFITALNCIMKSFQVD